MNKNIFIKLLSYGLLGVLAVTACQNDRYSANLAKAKNAAQNGDYQQAVVFLETAASDATDLEQKNELDRRRYVYMKNMALAYAKKGELTEAALAFKRLSASFPVVAEATCLQAQAWLELHDLERAGAVLSRCLALGEKDSSEDLQLLMQTLQTDYKQQNLLLENRLESLVELYGNYPDSNYGQMAAKRLPAVLLSALQKPEELGAPHEGDAQPFDEIYRFLTIRFPDSPEAQVAREHRTEYYAAYAQKYAAELTRYESYRDYQRGHSFCRQMELFYIKMRRVSLDIGMLVDVWIKTNAQIRMSSEERLYKNRTYGKDRITHLKSELLELQQGIKGAVPVSSHQKWIYDRMNTAIKGLITLQRVTDEYLASNDERSRQQRNNITMWLDFFILQLNLDIKWVCPDSDALPPAVSQEEI